MEIDNIDIIDENDKLPWVEKYRPATLDELSSHNDIITTLNRFIEESRLPHLLFYGPAGTGKTTTILACARKIYGDQYKSMILELNASDDRGIDVVREQIKSFASTKRLFSNSNFKLIVLDEADSMTNAAQAALRRVIEKYAKNVRFCLICNYVSKIIPAIQSRCTKFRFAPIPSEQMLRRLEFIALEENIRLTENGKTALMSLAEGDMRKLLNILQATCSAFNVVNEETVYSTTGKPLPSDIESCLEWLLGSDNCDAFNSILNLVRQKGVSLQDIIQLLTQSILTISMPKNMKVFILERMADIERNISIGCDERLQLGGLVAGFMIARNLKI